jgi:transposase-like protein
MRAIASGRLRKRRGRYPKLALEHAYELLTGELTVAELARREGVSPDALRKAWRQERGPLVRELQRRFGGL